MSCNNDFSDYDDLDFEVDKLFKSISKKRDKGRKILIKCDFCGYTFEKISKRKDYPLLCPICGNYTED